MISIFIVALMAKAATHALGFDWDEFLMICMGLAGVAGMYFDHKKGRHLDDFAVDIVNRLATLEVWYSTIPSNVMDRLHTIETNLEVVNRVSSLNERLARIEATLAVTEETSEGEKEESQ